MLILDIWKYKLKFLREIPMQSEKFISEVDKIGTQDINFFKSKCQYNQGITRNLPQFFLHHFKKRKEKTLHHLLRYFLGFVTHFSIV